MIAVLKWDHMGPAYVLYGSYLMNHSVVSFSGIEFGSIAPVANAYSVNTLSCMCAYRETLASWIVEYNVILVSSICNNGLCWMCLSLSTDAHPFMYTSASVYIHVVTPERAMSMVWNTCICRWSLIIWLVHWQRFMIIQVQLSQLPHPPPTLGVIKWVC